MDSHLTVLLTVAAVWLAAGVVAEGMPRLHRARTLRRRVHWLFGLTLTGLGLTGAVLMAGLQSPGAAPADRAAAALALATGPALLVAVCTLRRLRRLSAGAGAFALAPRTPAPHGLRAAAAHPLIGLPLQVTGVATVVGVLSANGFGVLDGPGITGPAITVAVLAMTAVAVRHALRHNRLAERALSEPAAALREPAGDLPRTTAGALHV
ncbi:hypothetical protein AWW66_11520 [Micromonospora rosaria]|uniref:Uncharacterized protein n=1 Tax=Micromonospora rosaria TaxID=47874 RepID=A0A136PTV2_9ACTN|nr:hypothetical protein [Micromonospora rosaria]KXK61807.1 hypothetical protein AWW66_11520 [Micromonospora rosaria]